MNRPAVENEFPLDTSPELLALEAALASSRPVTDETALEKAKAHALLELCRQAAPASPNLIETILDAGEQRITVSLRQYVRMERFRAGVVGLVLGLLLGGLFNALGMVFLYLLLKAV